MKRYFEPRLQIQLVLQVQMAFRLHFRHAKGRYAEAAIGEGRIGCDQIKQRYLPSTKRNRRITREGAIQPRAARHIGHFPVPARTLHQPHRWGIHAGRSLGA